LIFATNSRVGLWVGGLGSELDLGLCVAKKMQKTRKGEKS
jgi:hypothetical protein